MVKKFESFKQKWIKCIGCKLCETRKNVVLARGQIPCDILFIGEGPGASEDVLGKPFCGPAGKLLDQIIHKSFPKHMETLKDGTRHWVFDIRYCMTNLICCLPIGEDGKKTTEPPSWAIESCSTRLRDFIQICNPKLVVCVGAESANALRKRRPFYQLGDIFLVDITHPAAILRANVAQQSLAVDRCVLTLTDAIYNHFSEKVVHD